MMTCVLLPEHRSSTGELSSTGKNEFERSRQTATRLVLVVEYRGTGYAGFQLQINAPTIQGELEKAVESLTGKFSRVYGSSRTDSGVHAIGQVVAFDTASQLAPRVFIEGLNHYLPDAIAVREAYRVSPDFDVRRRALSRRYRYQILNRVSRSPLSDGLYLQVKKPLDVEEMNRTAADLIGTHDFGSFASLTEPLGSTVRNVIQAAFTRKDDMIYFDMEANAFLPHQVRNTVGILISVGRGRISREEFKRIVEASTPGLVQPTAPAHALTLIKVNYKRQLKEESL